PQSEDRVCPTTGSGAGEIGVRRIAFIGKPGDEIGGQKRRIGSNARDVGAVRTKRGGPIEAGQHAGERAGEARYAVCRDRQRVARKAGGVAIGVEHEPVDLRPQPLDDPVEQRDTAEYTQRLVTASHAPRLPAGEQPANDLHAASSSVRLALRAKRGCSSSTALVSPSKTMRSLPASATNRFPLARPIRVSPAWRARSTPQAVKPEREIRIGMPICTVLITISEVSRPVV